MPITFSSKVQDKQKNKQPFALVTNTQHCNMTYKLPPKSEQHPRPNKGFKEGVGKQCKADTNKSRPHFTKTGIVTFPDHADFEGTLDWLMNAKTTFEENVSKITLQYKKVIKPFNKPDDPDKAKDWKFPAAKFGRSMKKFHSSIFKRYNIKLVTSKIKPEEMNGIEDHDFRLWQVIWDQTWNEEHIEQLKKENRIVLSTEQKTALEGKVKVGEWCLSLSISCC